MKNRVRIVALALGLAFADLLGAQTYTISTFAGGGLPQNISGPSASLGEVNGVAVDATGNVFMTLGDYNVVMRMDARTGVLTQLAGNGTPGYSGDNGSATAAQLSLTHAGYTSGLAVDARGSVYIADPNNNCVRKVANGVITTVAGNGTTGFSGDNGPATSATLRAPRGVAVDSAGNVYIADTSNSAIRKVSNGMITTIAGDGTPGFGGDNGPATSAELRSPMGLALDSAGNLYIADWGNLRIRKISNGVMTTIAGGGNTYPLTSGPVLGAQFAGPQGVAVSPTGDVYVADGATLSFSGVFKITNGTITVVAGASSPGLSGDNGPAASARLGMYLEGVAVDSGGNIYIADSQNTRVRKVASSVITTVAGGGGSLGDGGPAINAQLYYPGGTAVDSAGNVYIADSLNYRVRKIVNGVITTVAGDGTTGFGGDNGPANISQLSIPWGIAVDSAGRLYIADYYNNCVREVTNGVITTIAGTGKAGYGGDGGPATNALLKGPAGIAVDTAGSLYIAELTNNRVRKVTNGVITTVAGDGTAGFSGDNGPATSAQLSFDGGSGYGTGGGIAVDSSGNLYIADTYNNRIRKVSNGVITTVVGNGQPNPVGGGDDGPASDAQLDIPTAVAVDSSGGLYIMDAEINRIRKVANGVITTVAGAGLFQGGFSGDNGPATAALLNLSPPYVGSGISVDTTGNVYLSDTNNHRIRLLTPLSSSCTFSLSSSSLQSSAAGGEATLTITSGAGCSWTISGLPDWITISGSATGSGTATVTLIVAPNSGSSRSVQISVAGITVTVNQASGVLLVNTGGVVNGAGYTAPVVAGSIAAIFGNFLLPAPTEVSAFPIPTNLGGLSFQFGSGTLAPLFYANVGQVNAQVPWELEGQSQTTIIATINGQTSAPQTVSLATYAPGIFALNSEGTGSGAILDANYHLVDASNPAIPGQTTILIYCTGLGPVSSNQPATGAPASLTNLAHTFSPVTATIGGVAANVTFSGLAPGYAGLYQVNAQVPAGLATNSAATVTISIGGVQSNSVTIAVQ